jgi:hypothetical protein
MIYGPVRFIRKSTHFKPGCQQEFTDTFRSNDPAAQFSLVVVNGSPKKKNLVKKGQISVNGNTVVTTSDFKSKTQTIEKSISVADTNTLEVQLASALGTYITVSIICTANCPQTGYFLYPNPTDPLVLENRQDDGTIVDLNGKKTSQGIVTNLTAATIQRTDGNTTSLGLDNNGLIVSAISNDNTRFDFTWPAGGGLSVVAASADGKAILNVTVPPATVQSSQIPADPRPAAEGPIQDFSELIENSWLPGATRQTMSCTQPISPSILPALSSSDSASVRVLNCNEPYDVGIGAVKMIVVPATNPIGRLPYALPASSQTAPGTYSFNIPVPFPDAGANVALCVSLIGTPVWTGSLCKAQPLVAPVCAALGIAALQFLLLQVPRLRLQS